MITRTVPGDLPGDLVNLRGGVIFVACSEAQYQGGTYGEGACCLHTCNVWVLIRCTFVSSLPNKSQKAKILHQHASLLTSIVQKKPI